FDRGHRHGNGRGRRRRFVRLGMVQGGDARGEGDEGGDDDDGNAALLEGGGTHFCKDPSRIKVISVTCITERPQCKGLPSRLSSDLIAIIMKKIPPPALAPAAGAPKRPRGRPRSFDREQALDRAMDVFWRQGFEGASLSDLTKAMEINPPSLYAAFGDKEQLFIEAMERYQQRAGESCPYCDEPTAHAAIEKLLLYMAHELTSAEHPRGCLMAMAAATSNSAS